MTAAPVYGTVDEVLAGRPATSVTRRLVQLAIDGGLRPHQARDGDRFARDEHGLYLIYVDYPSADGLFGALYVSAVNGNTDRAVLCHGNNGRDRTYGSVREIRAQLAAWKQTVARQKTMLRAQGGRP
jgi:hypothetical protein